MAGGMQVGGGGNVLHGCMHAWQERRILLEYILVLGNDDYLEAVITGVPEQLGHMASL